jgi:hypothetical protein
MRQNLWLDKAVRETIGRQLRLEYRAVTAAPLPDEHVYLLLNLRHKQRDRERDRGAPGSGRSNSDRPSLIQDRNA